MKGEIFRAFFESLAQNENSDYKRANWSSHQGMMSRFFLVDKLINFSDGLKVLDIGCGPGNFEGFILERYPEVSITGMDYSKLMLEIAVTSGAPCSFVLGNITDIPFEEAEFDLVLSLGVLQNFDGEITEAIGEVMRVTKNNGQVLITTTDANQESYKTKETFPQERKYNPEVLKKEFEERGLTNIEMNAFSTKDGAILPLHEWNKFYIFGTKCK